MTIITACYKTKTAGYVLVYYRTSKYCIPCGTSERNPALPLLSSGTFLDPIDDFQNQM